MLRMTLDLALESAARAAAAEWPTIDLDRATFVAYLRERSCGDDGAPSMDRVPSQHAKDLYLACACVQGLATAWRELDRGYLSRLREYVARIDGSDTFVDEVREVLSERLLPTPERPSRLAGYSGQGPLGAWLRIAATRVAQDLKRSTRPTDDIDDHAGAAADGTDVEVAFLKRQFKSAFVDAFQAVLETLSQDERNMLRLHYLDGLTIEQVGRTYGVSRATAARHLASARATIVERVRATLADRVDVSAAGPASVLAFVESQLDLSLRFHLT